MILGAYCAQRSFRVELTGPYGVLVIEFCFTSCKVSTLHAILSRQPQKGKDWTNELLYVGSSRYTIREQQMARGRQQT